MTMPTGYGTRVIPKRGAVWARPGALMSVRLLAAPGGLEIRGRQGVPGGLGGRADGISRLRTELLVEELVQHLVAGLRPVTDRHLGLRPDAAGVRLAVAEGPQIADSSARGRDGLDRADLCLRRRLSARAGQKHKHDAEPECHAQQESHDPNPCTPFPAALVEAAFRAATIAASLEGHVPVSKRMRRIFS